MREIKFRAWDKKSKKIREVIDIVYTNKSFDYMGYKTFNEIKLVWLKGRDIIYDKDIQISRKKSECELIQYTGLKDKNGVEIYNKDIIRDGSRLWGVEISNLYGVVLILLKDKKITRPYIKFEKHLIDNFEVVGSIYENSEILENDKKDKR